MAEKKVAQEKSTTKEKKTTSAKKSLAVRSAAASRRSATKSSAKRLNKGDALVCGVCGFSVIVDEMGDVMEAEEIICCEQPMKQRTSRARASAK